MIATPDLPSNKKEGLHTTLDTESKIAVARESLFTRCKDLRSQDVALRVRSAFDFAAECHDGQYRASGDPYILHPAAVAEILLDLDIDTASIIAGLLHDVVEDTGANSKDICARFGHDVGELVEGVTKLSKLSDKSKKAQQAANIQKLLMAAASDVRVLVIKFADRLHNMQTIGFLPPEKQRRIAWETLEIFAPMANQFGLSKIYQEMENLSFAILYPEPYSVISQKLETLRTEDPDIVEEICKELSLLFGDHNLKCDVSGREKSPASIHGKMMRRKISFDRLTDIIAFRVLVEDVSACYEALGIIHTAYKIVPGRFKDYISMQKPNGYQSLHTGIVGPSGRIIEIQVRSNAMHAINEYGVAAHWLYKKSSKDVSANLILSSENKKALPHHNPIIHKIQELLKESQNPEDLLEHTKLDMQIGVYCFTPNGKLIALPSGATPVDFAYAVHSEVGNQCGGARVNGHIVRLSDSLQNGDQVEIFKTNRSGPSADWENFVVSGRAKAHIRRYIRQRRREDFISIGRQRMEKLFRERELVYNDLALAPAPQMFNLSTPEDVLAHIGEGKLGDRSVFNALFGKNTSPRDINTPYIENREPHRTPQRTGISLKGLSQVSTHMARCCHPMRGDRIVGIVATGSGITVHTRDCKSLIQFADQPGRWIDLVWDDKGEDETFIGRLHISVHNRPGALSATIAVFSQHNANVHNLKTVNRSDIIYEFITDLEVSDIKHLNHIIGALRASPHVCEVVRGSRSH